MSRYVDNFYLMTEECCNCGMAFAITQDFYDRKRRDQGTFYCPRGHPQHYIGKTREQKLKEELNCKNQQLKHVKQQQAKTSKSYQKMRNRIKNGVCPCCNRTFQNLLNHMKKEHPDFGSSNMLKSTREVYGLTQSALAEEIGITAPYVSMYEREKPVPVYAEESINNWLDANSMIH